MSASSSAPMEAAVDCCSCCARNTHAHGARDLPCSQALPCSLPAPSPRCTMSLRLSLQQEHPLCLIAGRMLLLNPLSRHALAAAGSRRDAQRPTSLSSSLAPTLSWAGAVCRGSRFCCAESRPTPRAGCDAINAEAGDPRVLVANRCASSSPIGGTLEVRMRQDTPALQTDIINLLRAHNKEVKPTDLPDRTGSLVQ